MWWSIGLAVLAIFVLLGLLFWKLEMRMARSAVERSQREIEQRQRLARQRSELERDRTMLYDEMTVDEAQQLVWAWEEMTEDERGELPLRKRVEFRRISADLAAHRRKWKMDDSDSSA
ncbi:MAG: hypothetical protein ACYTGV_14010 [Planctomycetota bacterium]